MRGVFFIVALAIWSGAHVYVGRRLIEAARPRPALRWLGWGLLAFNVVVTAGAMAGRRRGLGEWFETVEWLAYLSMGVFVLLWCLVLIRDLVWLGYRGWEWARKKMAPPGEAPEPVIDEGRRRALFGLTGLGLVAATGTGAVYGYYEARRLARTVKVKVPIKDLPKGLEGLRIVQISDVHVGPTITGEYLRAVVERVNELEPDVVAITGDLVDGVAGVMAPELASLRDIRARHGAFFCTGNHEYYWDAPAWCRVIEDHGVQVLNNRHVVIEHGGEKVVLAGATDLKAERHLPEHASDPKKAIEGAPAGAGVRILLAHQPNSIVAAEEAGFDLQLSGHTHGGQFWPWAFFVHFAHKFTAGLHQFRDRTWIYVSRGTGYWGPPMRIGAPSEITLLELERA